MDVMILSVVFCVTFLFLTLPSRLLFLTLTKPCEIHMEALIFYTLRCTP